MGTLVPSEGQDRQTSLSRCVPLRPWTSGGVLCRATKSRRRPGSAWLDLFHVITQPLAPTCPVRPSLPRDTPECLLRKLRFRNGSFLCDETAPEATNGGLPPVLGDPGFPAFGPGPGSVPAGPTSLVPEPGQESPVGRYHVGRDTFRSPGYSIPLRQGWGLPGGGTLDSESRPGARRDGVKCSVNRIFSVCTPH